jgi:hypothetical protein
VTDEPETRLSDLAREVVENAAPDELELLPDVTAAWLAGDLTADGSGREKIRWRGGAIGAGFGADLLVTVVYPVLVGAVTPLLAAATARGWQKVSGRFGRKPAPVDQIIPPGVIEQADLVRANILKSAADLGVPPERAELIAANAYAALLRRQIGDR